jgi:hypothetical protein
MRDLAILACAAALLSCQSQPYAVSNPIRFAYPNIAFDGTYAPHLTVDDVRQMVAIAKSQPDILKPIHLIIADEPSHATVKTGNPQRTGHPLSSFEVRRENGRWHLIDKSLYTTRETIITS